MSGLLTEKTRLTEALHIREDVQSRLVTLQNRRSKWRMAGGVQLFASAVFFFAGCWLSVTGQLPEEIELPYVSEKIKGITNGGTGSVRNNSIGRLDRTQTAAGDTNQKIHNAISNGNWKQLQEITTEANDGSTKPEIMMLQAQVAYLAGDKAKSIDLIKTYDLGKKYPEQVWRIETLYAESSPNANYQISREARKYRAEQDMRGAFAEDMFWAWLVLMLSTLPVIVIVRLISSSIKKIESWLGKKDK